MSGTGTAPSDPAQPGPAPSDAARPGRARRRAASPGAARRPREIASPGPAQPETAPPESTQPEKALTGLAQPETAPAKAAQSHTAPPDSAQPEAAPERPSVPLLEPRDGLPELVVSAAGLAQAARALGAGEGPVAVDAERASGFRYGHRAFLVQLRRRGAGTVLIDPVACPDLSSLDAALADTEAVLHAASQDLPCLAEIGYRPRLLFDTELAGRLLGYPRVGLGTLVEEVLGLALEKSH